MAGAATSGTNYNNECLVPTANVDGTIFTTQFEQRGQLCEAVEDVKPSQKRAVNLLGTDTTKHYKIIIVGESGLGKTTATQCLLHDLKFKVGTGGKPNRHSSFQ